MRPDALEAKTDDVRSLAAALAPVLIHACGDRLADITWFKADWQRGGAATGTATYTRDDGAAVPVVLKLPVRRRELFWIRTLQDETETEPVVPRLFASGDELGGYDLTWIVIEHFAHGPLGLHWHEDHVPRVAEAAARFQAVAAKVPVDEPPRVENWGQLIEESIRSVTLNNVPEPKQWKQLLRKELAPRLDDLVATWQARRPLSWLHGDLHLANAMSRRSLDDGPVALIDLAEVHVGHWVEDAVYLERQLWARPERLKRHKPVRAMGDARRRLGLPVGPGDSRLAMIRRALLAATAPRFIKSEGHPRHLKACLRWLETSLAELG